MSERKEQKSSRPVWPNPTAICTRRIPSSLLLKAVERFRRINRDSLTLSRFLLRSSTKVTKAVLVPRLSMKPD